MCFRHFNEQNAKRAQFHHRRTLLAAAIGDEEAAKYQPDAGREVVTILCAAPGRVTQGVRFGAAGHHPQGVAEKRAGLAGEGVDICHTSTKHSGK